MSVRLKIFLPLAGFILLFTLYLTQWWYPDQAKQEIVHHIEDVEKHLNTLGVLLVKPLLENNLAEIYATFDELKEENENWNGIQLHAPDGALLYPLENSDIKSNARNKTNYKITHPVDFYGKSLGVITVYYDTGHIEEYLENNFFKLNIILGTGLVFFVLFTFFLIEILVRYPLVKLSIAANQLRKGIFDTPLPKEKSDEVGALVSSFNLMRSNIQSYQLSLKKEIEDRRILQYELEKRTLELEDQKLALDEHSIVSISNALGQYTYVNDKLCEISEFSRDELIGMNQYMLLAHDDYHETFFTDLVSNLKSNHVWQGDVTNIGKNGKEFISEMTIVPFFDRKGALYQYISIMTDITHLKDLESELRKSTQQVRNIIDSSPTILITAEPSGDFTLIYVSDNIEKLLGYHPNEIINKPDFWFDHIHPDDRLSIFPNIIELFVDGHYEDDYRFIDKRGDYRWFNNQLNMVYDDNGKPLEIIGTLTDITDRRHIDEALSLIAVSTSTESDEKFFTLLVSNISLALQVDYAFITEFTNEDKTHLRSIAAWGLGEPIENCEYNLIGTPCHDVIRSGNLCQYNDGIQDKYPEDILLVDLQIESYLGVPIRDSEGEIIGTLIVMDTKPLALNPRLISIFNIFASRAGAELERQKSQAELIQFRDNLQVMVNEQTYDLIESRDAALAAERAMSGFLANMSHELRTPLHGILSFARFGIKRIETATKEKLLDYFTEIHDSGSNLLKLLTDLLDLSKLRAGKMAYDYSQCNMKDLVQSLCSELYAFASEQKIRLELNEMESTSIVEVEIDKERIMQVLRNILVNALKYSPKNSLVEIKITTSENKMLQVSVCDEGVGIPDDELVLVFEAFSQSSNTKTNAGGTGLGLPICKEIIEQGHKGRIKAVNRDGAGACFIFTIPKSQSEKI